MNIGLGGSGCLLSLSKSLSKSSLNVKQDEKIKRYNQHIEINGLRSVGHTASDSDLPASILREQSQRSVNIVVNRGNEQQASRSSRESLMPQECTIIENEFVGKTSIKPTDLVREDLDDFLEMMVFAFSKLEAELKGSISIKEALAAIVAYLASIVNLSALVKDDYESVVAWLKFTVSGFSAGAMYANAILGVINDPVTLKEKLVEFSKLPKLERAKTSIFMAVVVIISLYSPFLDASNAHDGVIRLVGGDIADPSRFHKILGIVAGLCNWGAESILPILLGLRIAAGVEAEVREIIYADKDKCKATKEIAKHFCELVSLYNESIVLTGDKNNLVLDVNNKDIVVYKSLLSALNSDPYLLEAVIKIVHGDNMQIHPVMGRISGLVKVTCRSLIAFVSAIGLSKVMAMPSILSKLGVSGKVDCVDLVKKLKTVHINPTLEAVKGYSYAAQGATFMDNLVTLGGTLKVFPYAASHSVKGAKRAYNTSRGVTCTPPLTTNGLKRLWSTTATPVRLFAAIIGGLGACCYTWVASGAIEGAQNLAASTRCANVTIPGINEDEVNSVAYTILAYGAVVLLFFILLGGAPSAWASIADRVCPSKKGPKVMTRKEYDRQRKNAEKETDVENADTKEQEGASMKKPVSRRKKRNKARISMRSTTRVSIEKPPVKDEEASAQKKGLRFSMKTEGTEELWPLMGSQQRGDEASRQKQGSISTKAHDWTCTEKVRFKNQDDVAGMREREVVTALDVNAELKMREAEELRVKLATLDMLVVELNEVSM